jgi:hypothetical protein
MAGGTGLATALAALKGHAAAVAVVGTLVVGGSAAAVAVTTGAVHLPGSSTTQGSHGKSTETATNNTAAACANNGDAQRLADLFAPMFDSADSAKQSICTLFVGSDGHTVGFGEVQQALEITAAIEVNGGATDCLTSPAAHGQGTPTTHGKPAGTPTPQGGSSGFSVPTSTTATTMSIVKQIFAAEQHGTPLALLAQACGASHAGGSGQPTETPGAGAKPTGTPGARPTGTPGHP